MQRWLGTGERSDPPSAEGATDRHCVCDEQNRSAEGPPCPLPPTAVHEKGFFEDPRGREGGKLREITPRNRVKTAFYELGRRSPISPSSSSSFGG